MTGGEATRNTSASGFGRLAAVCPGLGLGFGGAVPLAWRRGRTWRRRNPWPASGHRFPIRPACQAPFEAGRLIQFS